MSARISVVLFSVFLGLVIPGTEALAQALNNHPIAAHHQDMLSRLVRPLGPSRTAHRTAPPTIFLLPILLSLARTHQAVAEELFSTAGDGKLADTSLTATGSICMTNDLAAVGFSGIPAPRHVSNTASNPPSGHVTLAHLVAFSLLADASAGRTRARRRRADGRHSHS
jgi:hypothetical protein